MNQLRLVRGARMWHGCVLAVLFATGCNLGSNSASSTSSSSKTTAQTTKPSSATKKNQEGSDEDAKPLAPDSVAKIENVRTIVNELAVMGSSSLTSRSNDAILTSKVKAS